MATSTLGSGTVVLAGTTSGTTTVTATAVAGTTTLTLPAATDTLVGKATTDTLTNKTLTGAVMNGTLGATTPSTVAATTISASSTATFAAGAVGTPSITTTGDTNTGIFFPAADTIAFTEGGVEAMRIDSSGNVGIGTSSPQTKIDNTGSFRSTGVGDPTTGAGLELCYRSSVADVLSYNRSTSQFTELQVRGSPIAFLNAGGEQMRIDSSGNLLVGATSGAASEKLGVYQTTANVGLFVSVAVASSTANPAISSRKFDNNNTTSQIYHTFAFNNGASGAGGIQGNGASGIQFFSSSDARLKENIVELEPQLANIMALKPSKFDFIDGPKDCTGFIAQEMETVYSDAIGETPDGFKTIGGISIMETRLIKCIQEQQALIQSLTTRITALETL